MKLKISEDLKKVLKNLYIPHGSDETQGTVRFVISKANFISHTVQMKRVRFIKTISILIKLYIPHGSDETQYFELKLDEDFTLLYIPHGSDETLYTK